MDIEIREFITYLHNRKRTSHNTEVSYQRDLKKMAVYFADRGIYDIRDVGELEMEAISAIWREDSSLPQRSPEM